MRVPLARARDGRPSGRLGFLLGAQAQEIALSPMAEAMRTGAGLLKWVPEMALSHGQLQTERNTVPHTRAEPLWLSWNFCTGLLRLFFATISQCSILMPTCRSQIARSFTLVRV
jgi:hypothetical protein